MVDKFRQPRRMLPRLTQLIIPSRIIMTNHTTATRLMVGAHLWHFITVGAEAGVEAGMVADMAEAVIGVVALEADFMAALVVAFTEADFMVAVAGILVVGMVAAIAKP
jgi:hypothetical protein